MAKFNKPERTPETDSVLYVGSHIDVMQALAYFADGKYTALPDRCTHALVFVVPVNTPHFDVGYTAIEGVLEYDDVLRLKFDQCLVGNTDGIAGVTAHDQEFDYQVIDLYKHRQ